MPYISIVLGVIAIILGAVSVKTKGRKKAISGIVTGSVGVVLAILVVVMTLVALPALQKNQRDLARQNDVSVLTTDILSFQTGNRGQLPSVGDLEISSLSQIKSVIGDGAPNTDTAVYKSGANCDGVASARAYAITVLLENGSEYCQGS